MTQQIKLRRDTAANWALSTNNPILAQGEVGIETDNIGTGAMRLKVGDGVTAWNSLPYFTLITDGTYAGAGTSTLPPVISFGVGSPNPSNGNNGDIYISGNGTTTGASSSGFNTIYMRRLNSWVGIL